MGRYAETGKVSLAALICGSLAVGTLGVGTLGLAPVAGAAQAARPDTALPTALPVTASVAQSAGPASLTVYQNGLSQIRDPRRTTVGPGAGAHEVRFPDVAAGLVTDSVQISAPGAGRVVQQRYLPAVDMDRMLRASVGKAVTVVTIGTDGKEHRKTMTLLRADPSVVLNDDGRLVFGVPGRIDFPLSADDQDTFGAMALTPQLTAEIEGLASGAHVPLTLSYLTSGLSWSADHSAVLDAKQETVTVTSWASVRNDSGLSWQDADLSLVAGAVQAQTASPVMETRVSSAMIAKSVARPVSAPAAMNGYYLYHLPHPVSLADGETRRVVLTDPMTFPVRIHYEVTSQARRFGASFVVSHEPVSMVLSFDTPPDGQPLPAGTLRVYGASSAPDADTSGAAMGPFLGSDAIDGIEAGGEASLTLGHIFDVTAERRQVSYDQLSDDVSRSVIELTVHNALPKVVEVEVNETILGDWTIEKESAPHAKDSARSARWTLNVPASGKTVLTYQVRQTR